MHWLRRPVAWFAVGIWGFTGCVEQSPDTPSEDDVKAAKENILAAAPANMKFPVNADLEGKLTYLGLDVDTETVTPGKPFTLTHYWKVNEPLTEDWRLFIHLEAPGTKANHLNADHVPVGGKYPVTSWKKGEIIRDAHRVSVPANWKAPAVEIYAGIWKGPLRLKVTGGPKDGENRIVCAKLPTNVKPPEPKKLLVRKVKNGSIKVDGKLEDAWKDAVSTGAFVKTMDGAKGESVAEAKLLWDDKNLYVAFSVEDADVWSTLTARDEKLWTQEAVEVFLDADGDGKTYLELQANPKGAIFDSWLPAYRKNENDFDAGAKVAVTIDGTVEKRDDKDKSWTVEMAIPLEAARGKEKEMKNVPPKAGDTWKANFFRMDMPAGKPQVGTAWSPPLVGDFHALDKFGQITFADDKGELPGAAPVAPVAAPPKADEKKGDAKAKKGEAKPAK